MKKETIQFLVDRNVVDLDYKFSPNVQDIMAVCLLERRGLDDFLDAPMTDGALNIFLYKLSSEWAFFPKDASGRSRYGGYNGNKALVSFDNACEVLQRIHPSFSLTYNPEPSF